MPSYIAIVHKEPSSAFGISFPDFPGCVTAGDTIDEAKDMAFKALPFHIKGMLEDKESIPVPSSLEEIISDPKNTGAIAFLIVVVSPPTPKAVRVNITLPENVLRQIDISAKKRGMSRSSFLAHTAQKAI